MVDHYVIQDRIAFIGAFLIGHDDVSVVIEIGSEDEDKRYDPADRDMSVIISLTIHDKEERIHGPYHQ